MEYCLAIKGNETLTHAYYMGELGKHYPKQKQPISKDHMLEDSIYRKSPEEANRQKVDEKSPRAGGWGCWEEMKNDC